MPLPKLNFLPDSSDYVLQNGQEVIETQVEGGKARRRRDYANKPASVRVVWIFDQGEYQYFKAFYNSTLQKGSLPFLIDLILDNPYLEETTAYFRADSISTNDPIGLSIRVEAELEVLVPNSEDSDAAILLLYDSPLLLSILEQLTNYDLAVS